MRARSLLAIAAVSLTGLYAVAVSGPRSEPESTTTEAASRQILLAGDSLQPAAVVSPLEAGRPAIRMGGQPDRQTETASPEATTEVPEASHANHVMAGLEVAPQVRAVAAQAEVSQALDYAPIAATTPNIPAATGTVELGPESRRVEPNFDAPARGRGPVILIRGGNGSGHDDCKIHPNGLQRGTIGSAVNRLAPLPGGGVVGTSAPGGWRGGGLR